MEDARGEALVVEKGKVNGCGVGGEEEGEVCEEEGIKDETEEGEARFLRGGSAETKALAKTAGEKASI